MVSSSKILEYILKLNLASYSSVHEDKHVTYTTEQRFLVKWKRETGCTGRSTAEPEGLLLNRLLISLDPILLNIYANNTPKRRVLINIVLIKYYQYRGSENQEQLRNSIWHTENRIKYY